MSGKKSKEAMRAEAEKEFYTDSIERLQIQMKKQLNEWSVPVIEERIVKLRNDFKNVENKIKQMMCGDIADKEKKDLQSELNEVESVMFDLIDKLKKRVQEMQVEASPIEQPSENLSVKAEKNSQSVECVKCEKNIQQDAVENLGTMKFMGLIEEWDTFNAWLNETIEKRNFNASQKLKLLKVACQGGKAEKIVMLSADFDEAYKALHNNFGTKYRKVQCYMRKLYGIKAMSNASSDSITELLLAVDKCVEIFKEAIPNEYNVVTTYAVIEKLDRNTASNWERLVKATSESLASSSEEATNQTKNVCNSRLANASQISCARARILYDGRDAWHTRKSHTKRTKTKRNETKRTKFKRSNKQQTNLRN